VGPGVLVLLRHGQSTWNARNLFTGWHDVPLSERGVAEAVRAGETMRAAGVRVDLAVTSLLARAIETNRLALEALGQPVVPIVRDWRLNERHYGALQGLDKRETVARHGAEQTERWRRSYDVPTCRAHCCRPPSASPTSWPASCRASSSSWRPSCARGAPCS